LQAEEDRLMYVAATRARETLVISRWTGNQKHKAWGVLNDFLADAKELPVPHLGATPHVEPLDCSVEEQASATTSRIAANETARNPSWSITSVTAEAQHIARMTRAQDAEPDDATKVVSTDTPAHRADAGMAWGTLIHALLEHAMRYPSVTRDDLRRLAMWLIVEEPQLRVALEQALDTVERVAHTDFWQGAKTQAHFVETPFLVCESGQVTSGVIDLLFQTNAGWRIIDYKTDVSLAADIYQAQLDAYRDALGIIGCNVVDASIISVRSDKPGESEK
jgi:ATP-dependent helicase/nuclease subunit A